MCLQMGETRKTTWAVTECHLNCCCGKLNFDYKGLEALEFLLLLESQLLLLRHIEHFRSFWSLRPLGFSEGESFNPISEGKRDEKWSVKKSFKSWGLLLSFLTKPSLSNLKVLYFTSLLLFIKANLVCTTNDDVNTNPPSIRMHRQVSYRQYLFRKHVLRCLLTNCFLSWFLLSSLSFLQFFLRLLSSPRRCMWRCTTFFPLQSQMIKDDLGETWQKPSYPSIFFQKSVYFSCCGFYPKREKKIELESHHVHVSQLLHSIRNYWYLTLTFSTRDSSFYAYLLFA